MNKDDLIAIWKPLESVVVSLDRIGSYQVDHGNQAARDALDSYFTPETFRALSLARSLISKTIETQFPGSDSELETLAEDEPAIGYWQYPKADDA